MKLVYMAGVHVFVWTCMCECKTDLCFLCLAVWCSPNTLSVIHKTFPRCRTDVAVMTGISIILHASMISLYPVWNPLIAVCTQRGNRSLG